MRLPDSAPASLKPAIDHPFHTALLYLSLASVAAAPFFYGSYPPWISGFAVAVICALGCAHAVVSMIFGARLFAVPRFVAVCSVALLAWLSILVIRDAVMGPALDRVPALSVRTLPYGIAFFAAAMLGAEFGGTAKRLKILMSVLTGVGFVLAGLAIVEALGFDIRSLKASLPDHALRPSGIFVSPNRLAVMLSLCASCGIGLLAATFKEPEEGLIESRRRLARQAVLVLALAMMGAGIAYSLSRLTIASFGVGLGVVTLLWMRRSRRDDGLAFRDLPLSDRIQRVVILGMPVLVVIAFTTMMLAMGAGELRRRIELVGGSEGDSRLTAILSSLALFDSPSAAIFGRGLGSFEALFTAVQPASLSIGALPGRWSRLHSDWIQLGLEGGIPALAMLLGLLGAWVGVWWQNVKHGQTGREPEALGLRLIPLAGVLTVVVCSALDFPLRETGLALCFFFLTGALARTSETAPGARWKTLALGVPVLAGLIWSGWIAGRNTLACAMSPWRGQYFMPVDAGKDAAVWERSIQIDPGEPQLHYLLAEATDSAKDAPREALEKGLEHARIAEAFVPREFHAPWAIAQLAEKLGRYDEAAAANDRAIALFPENLPLRLEAGLLQLRRGVRGRNPGSSDRSASLEKALGYFHFVMQRDPAYGERIASWLEEYGCSSDEVARLWEGTGEFACLARARYFASHEQWEPAAVALNGVDPANLKTRKKELIWYHVLRGMLDFITESDESAINHWGDALSLGAVRVEQPAYYWMAERARLLSAETVEKLATVLADRLTDAPLLVSPLAAKLHQSGKFLAVLKFLEKTAGHTDYLLAMWADTAYTLGDFATAKQKALEVQRYKGAGSNWSKWYENLVARCDEQLRRDK